MKVFDSFVINDMDLKNRESKVVGSSSFPLSKSFNNDWHTIVSDRVDNGNNQGHQVCFSWM